jgi:F-type H+-transporting ATPase subunit gamma
MRTEKYIKDDLGDMSGFLNMIEAYEEISAIRMRKVKKSVLARRDFLLGLNEAFSYIIYSFYTYRKLMKKKAGSDILNTNGRSVMVLLSSNTGLYGDIILKTFSLFNEDAKKIDNKTDIVVTGRLGRKLFDTSGPKKEYKYFDLSDSVTTEDSVKDLLNYITNYTNVTVYHGVFKSILTQDPQKTYLTGKVMDIESNLKGYDASFIFEPSVEEVAEYFEKQILSLIFEQSLFESSLSKFASRMVNLDVAASNISTRLSSLGFELRKAKHKKTNKSIQENISGGSLWI